jgi:hypothetical protein
MLVINYKDGKQVEWHIGEPTTGLLNSENERKARFPIPYQVSNIDCIQADHDELEYILSQYIMNTLTNSYLTIPVPKNKKVATWYGDIAKTIIANL